MLLRLSAKTIFLFQLLIFCLVPITSSAFVSNGNLLQTDSLGSFIDIKSLDSIASVYEKIAHNYYQNGNYDSANVYYLKQLNSVKNKNLSSTDSYLGDLYINLGVMNFGQWRFEDALGYYRKAEEIYKGIDDDYIDLGSIYVNQAIIFRLLGDFDQAELHCNNAIRIFSRQPHLNYKYLNIAYYNLALINQYAENYTEAIKGFTKSINYNHARDTLIQINSLSGISFCYERLNNTSLAQQYHLSTIDLSKSYYGDNSIGIANYLMNYGLFNIEKLGNLKEGKRLIDLSLTMYLEGHGNKSDETSLCYYNLAEYYYIYNGNIEKSLTLLQKSLISAEPNFNDSSIYSNPEINTDRLNTRLIVTITLKGRILLDQYYKTNTIKNLVSSLETYELALQNIDKMRVRYGNENSRLIISKQQHKTFQEAIFVANLLYKLTNNAEYLQKSLDFNERAKAFSLLISIRNLKAKQFGGIPINLLEKEKDYARQLSLFEELIFEEKRKNSPNQLSIENWEEKLFWLKQENQQLLQDFEDLYPEYYRLKYDTKVISLNEIKNKLKPNEALIEYSLIDTLLFIYCFTNSSHKLYRIPIDSNFHNHLNVSRENLSIPRFSSNVNENYKNFCVSSFQLYRYLIEPCQDLIKGKSLIVIPDGRLSYLPFEALLTHPLSSESADYRHLPYLN